MADLQTLLDAIPDGGQYEMIRDALRRIDRTFPEQMAEIDLARVQRFVNDVDTGTRSGTQIRNDMFQYIVGSDVIQQRLGVDAATADALIHMTGGAQFATFDKLKGAGDINVNESAPLTILYGRNMQWYLDPRTNKWYVSYGLPNSDRQVFFEAEPDQMQALFGPGGRPPQGYQTATLQDLQARTNFTFSGNVSEIEGRGSFDEAVNRAQTLALDSGVLPEWARNDPAAMDIVYIAQAEGKSNDWVIEQISKLPSFKARFPGIENFKNQGLTTSEAVTAFIEYESTLKQLEKQFGRDGSRITPAIVGALAGKGYQPEVIQDTYKTFKRMEDYAPALQAFNEVLTANGEQPMGPMDQFNFLTGHAPQKVYDIYEASSLREAAVGAGLGDLFDASAAIDIALQTPGMTSLQQATQGMQQAAKLALRLRHEIDTSEFGLDVQDLIDVSLGTVPRSGKTEADIRDGLERAVQSAQSFIQERRATPFTGFSSSGTPQQRSLSNLRQAR